MTVLSVIETQETVAEFDLAALSAQRIGKTSDHYAVVSCRSEVWIGKSPWRDKPGIDPIKDKNLGRMDNIFVILLK